MPQVVVTKIDIDSRDFSGKTFTVSFNDYSHPSWITRNGGQTWTEFALSWLPGVNLARIRNVSSAQVSGATTFYGWVYGMHGFPWAVRSDDNGVNWFITSRWSGFNLVVEYKHYDRGLVVNQMMPLFRVRNLGSVNLPLAQTKLEYMLTPEGTSPMVWSCDWTPYGCQDVRATFGTYNVYLSLPNNAVVQPGAVSGQIQGRINKLDWSNMDQSNDYSYMANATDWTVNPRMTFWNADLRVWGGY